MTAKKPVWGYSRSGMCLICGCEFPCVCDDEDEDEIDDEGDFVPDFNLDDLLAEVTE